METLVPRLRGRLMALIPEVDQVAGYWPDDDASNALRGHLENLGRDHADPASRRRPPRRPRPGRVHPVKNTPTRTVVPLRNSERRSL
ncbi:hypothetical protein [Streptomyces sp. HF10]|uniref:hypothetical protein n=1 Tax=Streptomyces sp. HF10 TaxID=2692233 RepID=UPI003FA7EC34